MAKATTKIKRTKVDPEEIHAKHLKELEITLVENKETIEKAIEVLRLLDEHEVLNLARAGLNQSDKALTRVLNALLDNDITSSIQNVLLLAETLGKLDVKNLEKTLLKVNQGSIDALNYESEGKKEGWIGLFSALNDPRFIQGSNTLLEFVKAFGYTTEEIKEKQNIKDKIKTFTPQTSKHEVSTPKRVVENNKGLLTAAAVGASAVATALYVFRK